MSIFDVKVQSFRESTKVQNTEIANKVGSQEVTIIDPKHPLYGKRVKIVKMYKAKSKKQLLVEQEDGRRIRISCRETNFGKERLEEVKVNQVSVRTLLPLAELIANMVASQEGNIHEASIERKSINSSKWQHKPEAYNINLQSREQNQTSNPKDSIQELGTKSSASVNPVSSSTHSANSKGRLRTKKGTKQ